MPINKTLYCMLCNFPLSKINDSKEHLIINAIGGRKKISGVLCKSCNSQAGHKWDTALAKQLNPLNLLFKIKRDQGNAPPQNFETITGEQIRLHFDGTITPSKPDVQEVKIGNTQQIQIKARSLKEAMGIVAGKKKKYPTLNIEAFEKNLNIQSQYLNDPVKMEFSFGGDDAIKSLVKSVLVLAVKNEIDPLCCQNALCYLKNTDAKICFGFYYEKDPILNRPQDKIFHCIAIMGNSKIGLLLGYIELFGSQRIMICLSDSYTGCNVYDAYSIDPVSGEELDLQFDISLTQGDLATLYRHEKAPFDSAKRAFEHVMAIACRNKFTEEKNRVLDSAISHAFENCGAKENDVLTEEHIKKMIPLLFEKLMSFLKKHLNTPTTSSISSK